MATKQKITIEYLLKMFNCNPDELDEKLIAVFYNIDTTYRYANQKEYEKYILNVLKMTASTGIKRSREESLNAFEKGWSENLELLFTKGISADSLKPKYFRPNNFLRYKKKLITSGNLNLEYDLFTFVRLFLFTKYLAPFENICELGCGSCQNLLMMSELFPLKSLYGFDWTKTSSIIANYLAEKLERNIKGQIFDMMNPSPDVILKPNSAVITIHALEQIGTQYEKLLSFLINSKPGIVVHYEPILEFYEEDNVLDQLALVYSRKRDYLSGFYSELCKLQKEEKVEILEARRPYLGGIIHESSLIVWRPK